MHHERPTSPPVRPTLVFDGDCGFCTSCARAGARLLGSRGDTVPCQRAPLGDWGLTRGQCEVSVQWVAPDGSVAAGAAAIAALLRTAGSSSGTAATVLRWLGRALALPVVDRLAERAYRWVSAHRHQLPGGTPACRLPDDR